MTPDTIQAFLSLAIGFASAGLTASAYQLVTARPLSFRLLGRPARSLALAAVPLLTFAAPFIIMRNSIRGGKIAERRTEIVVLATVIAGFWSLMSGTAVVSVLRALGMLG